MATGNPLADLLMGTPQQQNRPPRPDPFAANGTTPADLAAAPPAAPFNSGASAPPNPQRVGMALAPNAPTPDDQLQMSAKPGRVRQMLTNFAQGMSMSLLESSGAGEYMRGQQQLKINQQNANTAQANEQTNAGYKDLTAGQYQPFTVTQDALDNIPFLKSLGVQPGSKIPLNQLAQLFQSAQGLEVRQKQTAASLAAQGLISDASAPGGVRPMRPEEAPLPLQYKMRLSALQQDIAQSRLNAARLDPNTPEGMAAQLALKAKMTIAQAVATRASAAMGMTDIAAQKFGMDYVNGFTTDSGQQIGLKQAKEGGLLPTSSVTTMGQTGAAVASHFGDISKMVDDLAQKGELGPIAGRWDAALAGKVGLKDPQMAGFLASTGLAASGVLRAHFGARGGQLMYDKFTQQLNAAGGDPENIKAVLGSWADFMNQYKTAGTVNPSRFNIPGKGGKGTAPVAPQAPPTTPTAPGTPMSAEQYMKMNNIPH